MWTVDFKGWWWNGTERCEPLSVRDEFSRYVLELRAVENAKARRVRKHFEWLFERHGLPQAIRSVNGSPFACTRSVYGLSRLSAWWVALGIELERGRRPGTRRTTQPMSDCIETSVSSWKALATAIRTPWTCGARSLTTSGRTKP